MQFDIITIFPEIFNSFLKESIIKKAQDKNLIKINIHNLRDWTKDKHKSIDDSPFGGGRGMIFKVGPVYRAVNDIKKKKLDSKKIKVILLTPHGKKLNQKKVFSLSKLKQIILICGRYEGIDERVAKKIADIELSIGDYVLMGGELPSMVLIESISRLVPKVLGKSELIKKRMYIDYPQYTRPKKFKINSKKSWKVPNVLLSGHHKKIEQWRKEHEKIIDCNE